MWSDHRQKDDSPGQAVGDKAIKVLAGRDLFQIEEHPLGGRKLLSDFEIGEFLVPPTRTILGTEQQRSALIHRLHVMANHGCMDEFNDDLAALAALPPKPSQVELDSVAASIQRGWAYEVCSDDWPAFIARIRQTRQLPHGKPLVMALTRGLFMLAYSYPGTVVQRLLKLRGAARLAFEAAF